MKKINITAIILLSMAWLFMSCAGHKANDEHLHEEEHVHFVELSAIQPGIEAYAKFEQPILNETTHIDLYLTDMKTRKNSPDKPAIFRFLHSQGSIAEKKILHQDKNGIYYTEITFNQPGTVELQFLYSTEGEKLIFPLGRFQVWESEEVMEKEMHAQLEHRHEEEESEVGLIELDKLQQWYISLQAEKPQIRELCTTISAIGKILPLPESKAKVSSPYRGKIIFTPGFRLKRPGDRVKNGDILAVIQPLAFSPEQVNIFNLIMEEQKVKLLMDKAYTEYIRAQKLYKENIIPKKHLITAETEYEIYKKNYENIKALKAAYFQEDAAESSNEDQQQHYYVKAPIDGILACTHIFRGEFVEPYEELCQIIDPHKIWLELQLHEKDIPKISSNKNAAVLISSAGQQWQIPAEKARLISLGIALSEETRTLPVIYELENQGYQFKIGMMVDVLLSCPTKERGLVIPEKALIEMEGVPYVFIQISEERFIRRPVEIIKHGGGIVQVLKGIEPENRVVVRGAYNLKLAASKAILPSAHEGHQH